MTCWACDDFFDVYRRQVYRCFVVFSHDWRIAVVPAVLWFGNLACSVAIAYITSTLRGNALLNTNHSLSAFLLSFLVITLITNLLTTGACLVCDSCRCIELHLIFVGLIVWRIWTITQQTDKLVSINPRRRGRTKLNRVVHIIIQSGLLYTTFVLVSFGAEVAGSNSLYMVSGMVRVRSRL